jgi:hypothetical protein
MVIDDCPRMGDMNVNSKSSVRGDVTARGTQAVVRERRETR